jgi:hypothetical protein
MDPADVLTIAIIVLVPAVLIVVALRYRSLWRSANRRLTEPGDSRSAVQSGEPLMQAVDAIAVEVERISEGQRYLTKVLAERGTSAPASPPPSTAKNEDA